ncbi:Kae1-associated serine/threonine protein kinase [Candidatus Pacearchaeota archaeon]|nr:Kae1-associated serine/threonine protein kinase [Candidatus Pacearchaeota archaeon]
MRKLIAQGAEAKIIQISSTILKQRIRKGYRISELDEKLRKQRTRKEAKLLEKAKQLIPVPKLIKMDEANKELEIEFIKGKKLAEHLDGLKNKITIAKEIGKNVARIHDAGIIHGDLTTSNMIAQDSKVYFIDFGLGFESDKIEDKAVDLHVLKEALEAKHFKYAEQLFQGVVKGYKKSKYAKETLKRLEKVEQRGRYKQSY